ncbi:MAG: hypothetical protein FWG79_08005 [Bacteroidales bacterium]|nr:hypothetical protein [Bacteroidales bacterium]
MSRKISISILLILLLSGSSVGFAQRGGTIQRGGVTQRSGATLGEQVIADPVQTPSNSTVETHEPAEKSTDSIPLSPRSPSAIDSRIDFKATDSLFFDLRSNTVHLFEKAQINYNDIELTAAKIEVHFDRDELTAFPKLDSLGKEVDRPFFKDDQQSFEAREMTYNLATQKARIKNIITQEDEMLIHGDIVKKLPDNSAFVQRARFTTCDLEHPHFHIVARRAKIIPSDKVVTGGTMLFLNDVPTPLVLPFGLFPNTSKYTSGILIPTYGESSNQNQGFFLRGGGFYWGINDHLDWRIEGDIYMRGEWAVRNTVQYAKRYKYNGRLNFEIGEAASGERETPSFSRSRTMRVGWNHSQDPKANQNSTFSAGVNYFNRASQSYSSNLNDRFDNQSNSNIAYQLRIANRFNLSATANMNYNMGTGDISATFPSLTFSMNPIYPFQRKVRKGNPKWYESFQLKYSMSANNQARGNDSSFWTQTTLREMQNGVRHNIPMDVNIKLMNGKINWTHGVQLSEHWNFKANYRGSETTLVSVMDPETNEILLYDSIIRDNVILRTEYGFFATRSYNYSTSFSTQLFGMVQFKRGLIRAFRHVMNPSVGFSFSPDFVERNGELINGWDEYQDSRGNWQRYNIYSGSPGGHPTATKSGSINFGLSNNFEMKVRDRSDTVRGERKVKLIDRLQLSTWYNLAADSLNWGPISLTASTTLFRNLNLVYNARFSLYARDSNNRSYNTFIWQASNKFLLVESESMSTGLSWSFSSKKREENTEQTTPGTGEIFEQSAAFGPQWSLNISYTIGYNNSYAPGYRYENIWGYPITGDPTWSKYNRRILQTLSFSGSLDLTEKWKISFISGFDFKSKKLATTTFQIARDLHCWSMNFSWTPFGDFRQWSFGIRLNSSMLGDVMKYDRSKTHREMDNYF